MNHVLQIDESATLSASNLLDAFTSDHSLTDIAQQIAGLNESSAPALASALVERGGNVDFCLGGVLEIMKDMGWYGDSKSFAEFVRVTCGFDVRQAQHLMRTYRYLTDKHIPWSAVKPLGWTKLRLLVNAEKLTADNAGEWVEKAAGKAMTVRALEHELKFVPEPPKPISPQLAVAPSSFTASTPIQQAGRDADEDVQTQDPDDEGDEQQGEIEYSPFLLKTLMQSAGPDKVLALFNELFPEVPVTKLQ